MGNDASRRRYRPGAVTCTSLNGRCGSTAGKTTYQSSAATATASTRALMIFPGVPNGRWRQIQPYTSALQLGRALIVRPLPEQARVDDQPLLVVVLRIAGRQGQVVAIRRGIRLVRLRRDHLDRVRGDDMALDDLVDVPVRTRLAGHEAGR